MLNFVFELMVYPLVLWGVVFNHNLWNYGLSSHSLGLGLCRLVDGQEEGLAVVAVCFF